MQPARTILAALGLLAATPAAAALGAADCAALEGASAAPFTTLSARRLCRYPLYPRHDGSGDAKLPAGFSRAAQ